MKRPEVTYSEYVQWGGRMPEASFAAASRHASAYLARLLAGRDWSAFADEVKSAVCACAEVDEAWGLTGGAGGSVSSESLGSYSYSVASGDSAASWRNDMLDAATNELMGTGLLCRVVL